MPTFSPHRGEDPPPPPGDCPQGGNHNWVPQGHDDVCTKCGARVTAR